MFLRFYITKFLKSVQEVKPTAVQTDRTSQIHKMYVVRGLKEAIHLLEVCMLMCHDLDPQPECGTNLWRSPGIKCFLKVKTWF